MHRVLFCSSLLKMVAKDTVALAFRCLIFCHSSFSAETFALQKADVGKGGGVLFVA